MVSKTKPTVVHEHLTNCHWLAYVYLFFFIFINFTNGLIAAHFQILQKKFTVVGTSDGWYTTKEILE